MIRFNPLFSPLFSVDDEYIRYDDGHTSGAPQEPEHQNMAGPHCSMGPHFQHRYKHYFYLYFTTFWSSLSPLIHDVQTSLSLFPAQAIDREELREGGFELDASVFFVYFWALW